MIVNPQPFSYRLIIGSLIIAIAVLSSFSYISYKDVKENQAFVEQENKLVENELSEMISQYDKIEVENEGLKIQFEKAKTKMQIILDSVKNIRPSGSLISKYKNQIRVLKLEKAKILAVVNTLQAENKALKEITQDFETVLANEKTVVKDIKQQNKQLISANFNLKEDLEKAKQLSIVNLEAQAIKRINSRRKVDTKYARKTNKIDVCFTITKNEFITEGEEDLYIQILDNKMNVVADKGSTVFGKRSLIYSYKKTINFKNKAQDVCVLIEKEEEETLEKGLYFVNVFHNGKTLGKTTIELK